MKRAASVLTLLLLAAPVGATPPDGATVAQHVKDALHPARPSTRKLGLRVSGALGAFTEYTAGQARKKKADGSWVLTVVLAPESARGGAVLVRVRPGTDAEQWLYAPAVRRVRKFGTITKYEGFLNSDFTYVDLGLADLPASHAVVGTEQHDGSTVYKLESVPEDRRLYARIVSWVSADTWLPVRREFYDPGNSLWKNETDESAIIDGVPALLHVRMEDVQYGSSSEIRASEVRYDVDVPDTLLVPENLPDAAASPLWTAAKR